MRSFGFPEILVILFPIAIYGGLIYCGWKFYELLSKIHDNVAGIRQAIERNGRSESNMPV